MPFNLGGPELIIILVIALIVIGPGKLPDVGAALGRSIREFRKAATDVKEATSIDTKSTPPIPVARADAAPVPPAPPPAAPAVPAGSPEEPKD